LFDSLELLHCLRIALINGDTTEGDSALVKEEFAPTKAWLAELSFMQPSFSHHEPPYFGDGISSYVPG
jgi:hypothetical protein